MCFIKETNRDGEYSKKNCTIYCTALSIYFKLYFGGFKYRTRSPLKANPVITDPGSKDDRRDAEKKSETDR